jgi:hypothetical protein
VKVQDAVGFVRHAAHSAPMPPVTPTSAAARVAGALPVPSTGRVLRSGVAAGATVLALSVASALTSRARRRVEGS